MDERVADPGSWHRQTAAGQLVVRYQALFDQIAYSSQFVCNDVRTAGLNYKLAFASIADLNVAAATHTAAALLAGPELDMTTALHRAAQMVVAHDLARCLRRCSPG